MRTRNASENLVSIRVEQDEGAACEVRHQTEFEELVDATLQNGSHAPEEQRVDDRGRRVGDVETPIRLNQAAEL